MNWLTSCEKHFKEVLFHSLSFLFNKNVAKMRRKSGTRMCFAHSLFLVCNKYKEMGIFMLRVDIKSDMIDTTCNNSLSDYLEEEHGRRKSKK